MNHEAENPHLGHDWPHGKKLDWKLLGMFSLETEPPFIFQEPFPYDVTRLSAKTTNWRPGMSVSPQSCYGRKSTKVMESRSLSWEEHIQDMSGGWKLWFWGLSSSFPATPSDQDTHTIVVCIHIPTVFLNPPFVCNQSICFHLFGLL